ncbi:MAG: PEP-CTERM sorting domain-containing protein [Acidobacteriota bacterium]
MKSSFLILALLGGSVASATTVFDNGAPNLTNAFNSDLDFSPTQVSFDDFTVGAVTLRQVVWHGIYAATNTASVVDSFTIQFFNNVAGSPSGAAIQSYAVSPSRVNTGNLVVSTYKDYLYTATIPDTVLAAGTYWISIFNNTVLDTDDNWYWSTSSNSGNAKLSNGGAAPSSIGVELSFALTDTASSSVPEPSSLLLSAAGLTGFAALRRRSA